MGSNFTDRRWTSSTVKLHIFAQTVAKVCNTATKFDADGNATMRHTFTTKKQQLFFLHSQSPQCKGKTVQCVKADLHEKSLQKATTFFADDVFCSLWHLAHAIALYARETIAFQLLNAKKQRKRERLVAVPLIYHLYFLSKPYFLLNLSTRPPASTNFCLPVK